MMAGDLRGDQIDAVRGLYHSNVVSMFSNPQTPRCHLLRFVGFYTHGR